MNEYPLFEFLPFETLISKNQKKYYHALSTSDKQGNSTFFIVFMLTILSESLDELLAERPGPLSSADRIRIFLSNGIQEFTRKDYLGYFKTISSATASRDLAMAVKDRLIKRIGDKNKTVYQIKDTLTHN